VDRLCTLSSGNLALSEVSADGLRIVMGSVWDVRDALDQLGLVDDFTALVLDGLLCAEWDR
jgi:hypothetical protein